MHPVRRLLAGAGLLLAVTARAEGPAEALRQAYDEAAAWVAEQLSAEEVQALPTIDQGQFVALFQPVLDALWSDDPEGLAVVRDQAAAGLAWLRTQPWGAPYADWLEPRMDYLDIAWEAARVWREEWERERQAEIARRAEAARDPQGPAARRAPAVTPTPEATRERVYRSAQSRRAWDRKVAQHPPPRRAAELVPRLKEEFRAEGVPPEWVWLAEVESSFNPDARSPAGARGLFQFMPATARSLGLRTFPLDDRTDPAKSARAAARYLRQLHERFGDWPLALAAYNAGQGRVGRILEARRARTFEAIAPHLPAETRFYVPKVLATVAAREQVDPLLLPAPARR